MTSMRSPRPVSAAVRLAALSAALLAALLTPAAPLAAEGFAGSGPWMVRAWFGDEAMIREVAAWGDHLQVDRNKGFVRVLADTDRLARLAALGFFVEVDEEASALIRLAESAQADWDQPETIPGFACYRTVEETFAGAQALVAAHPTLAALADDGDSWDKLTAGGQPGYLPEASSPARRLATSTARDRTLRIRPSSSARIPAMVQPAGVVTSSLSAAGWRPVASTIEAAP